MSGKPQRVTRVKFLTNRAEVMLSRGQATIIDIEDAKLVREYKWRLSSRGYVAAPRKCPEHRKSWLIHRLVMDAQPGLEIDHINHNRLDNRKDNLRVVTRRQNMMNMVPTQDGVRPSDSSAARLWSARIRADGHRIHIGSFRTREEAVKARLAAEAKYFGEHAVDRSGIWRRAPDK